MNVRFRKILSVCTIIALLCCILIISTAAETSESKSVRDFDGKRIGVQTGSVYVDNVYNYIKDPEVYYFDSPANQILAIASGKIDGAIAEESIMKYCTSSRNDLKLTRISDEYDEFALIFSKNETGENYRDEFNEFLRKIIENGELDKITAKWVDGSEDERVMESYTSLPDTNGTIILGTDPEFPPFEYMKNGECVGIEIELAALFCKEYGYALKIESANYSGLLAGVSSGKFDIGASAFFITEERKKSVNFSDAYLLNYNVLVYLDGDIATESVSFFDGIKDSFQKTFINENRWQMFVSGILSTLMITFFSVVFGTFIGFLIHFICRNGNKPLNSVSGLLRWIVNGTPEVVFLMVLYYVVFGKISISGLWAAIIGLTVIFACSVHDMLKTSENALDPGQEIAAKALGYSATETYFQIILPQTLRHFLPLYGSSITTHIKATAIVGYISVVDITKVGDLVRGSTYEAFFPLISITILYFLLEGLFSLIIKLLIKVTNPKGRSKKRIVKGLDIQ